jgi:hypothetical protein
MKKFIAFGLFLIFCGALFFVFRYVWQRQLAKSTYTISTLSEMDIATASLVITKLASRVTREQISGWKKPVSSEEGMPIVTYDASDRSNTFFMYNLKGNSLKNVGRNIASSEGDALNNGAGGPKESMDLLHTAFVDKTQTLYVLSNETLQKERVFQAPKNGLLSFGGWSPDGSKFLFSTLLIDGEDAGGPTYRVDSDKIFNIDNGALMTLPKNASTSIKGFLDNDHVLVEIYNDGVKIVTALNLETLQPDPKWYEQKIGFVEAVTGKKYGDTFASVIFSLDGSKFAGNVSVIGAEAYTNPPPGLEKMSKSSVIYGDAVNKTVKTLAQGYFAQYQFVRISPSGTRVAYEEQSSPAFTFFWVYNAKTGEQRAYKFNYSARIIRWLSDSLVFIDFYSGNVPGARGYGVLDINANTINNVTGVRGEFLTDDGS